MEKILPKIQNLHAESQIRSRSGRWGWDNAYLRQASTLFRDQLGSVRAIYRNSDGKRESTLTYSPFGVQDAHVTNKQITNDLDSKGFVGERFDAGAGQPKLAC